MPSLAPTLHQQAVLWSSLFPLQQHYTSRLCYDNICFLFSNTTPSGCVMIISVSSSATLHQQAVLWSSLFPLLSGSVEHRAQVILYTLLMSDRCREPVDSGLLFYMKSSHMLGVPAFLHEKRALIMKRNEVARYLALDKATGTRVMPGKMGPLVKVMPGKWDHVLHLCQVDWGHVLKTGTTC